MQQRAKERIYLSITVFCVLMCAFLLISVFLDIPIASVSHTREVHAPFMPAKLEVSATEQRTPVQTERGFEVTNELLAKQISDFLPEGFPIAGMSVDILADGRFDFELTIKKDSLKDFLESGGVKLGLRRSIAIGLLPDRLDVTAQMQCLSAGKSGADISLSALTVNGKPVNTDFLPEEVFGIISRAINAAMAASGLDWSGVTFEDGAMYFVQ